MRVRRAYPRRGPQRAPSIHRAALSHVSCCLTHLLSPSLAIAAAVCGIRGHSAPGRLQRPGGALVLSRQCRGAAMTAHPKLEGMCRPACTIRFFLPATLQHMGQRVRARVARSGPLVHVARAAQRVGGWRALRWHLHFCSVQMDVSRLDTRARSTGGRAGSQLTLLQSAGRLGLQEPGVRAGLLRLGEVEAWIIHPPICTDQLCICHPFSLLPR